MQLHEFCTNTHNTHALKAPPIGNVTPSRPSARMRSEGYLVCVCVCVRVCVGLSVCLALQATRRPMSDLQNYTSLKNI